MRPAFSLGIRLALGTAGQRARTVVTLVAGALASLVLLLVWGVAHSRVGTNDAFGQNQVTLLVAGTVGMVALPVLVLVVTVARLSARLRDRRLANLRLLGLSTSQTRVVAATEVGVAGALGALLGTVVFLALVPLAARTTLAGQGGTAASFLPPAAAWACALVGVPLAGVAAAVLPQCRTSRRLLARSRDNNVADVPWWRVVPLIAGFLVCWIARGTWINDTYGLSQVEVGAILGGVTLLAVGMLLVVPVFVRLVATLVLRAGSGPLATLVGRRLQAQPAGVTRVVSVLMVGLFIVVASRAVVAAFLATPQYLHAADFVERAQMAETLVSAAEEEAAVETVAGLDGVDRVASFPVLHARAVGQDVQDGDEATVLVATCAELAGPGRALPGCRDGVVNLVGDPWFGAPQLDGLELRAVEGWAPHGARVPVPTRDVASIDQDAFDRLVGALHNSPAIVLAPSSEEIGGLTGRTDRVVVAHAGPGRFLYDRMEEAGLQVRSVVDLETYDFVRGTLTLVWTLAVTVLGLGLLTFTTAGIDRALARRRELTALRLVGTPGRLLLTAQWLEAALPTVFGTLLAVLAGGWAGATWFQLGEDQTLPLTETFAMAAAAVVASVVLAAITTVGTMARLGPEHIRAE